MKTLRLLPLMLLTVMIFGLVALPGIPHVWAPNPAPTFVQSGVASANGVSHTTLTITLSLSNTESALVAFVSVTGSNPGSSIDNVKVTDQKYECAAGCVTTGTTWTVMGQGGSGANTAYLWAFGVTAIGTSGIQTGSDTFTADITTCGGGCSTTNWNFGVVTYTNAWHVVGCSGGSSGSTSSPYSLGCLFNDVGPIADACGMAILGPETTITDTDPYSASQTRTVTGNPTPGTSTAILVVSNTHVAGGSASNPTHQAGCGWSWTGTDPTPLASSLVGVYYANGPTDMPYAFTPPDAGGKPASCDDNINTVSDVVGPSANSLNNWGSVDKSMGQYDPEFTGRTVTSVTFYLCALSNDNVADNNNVVIGTYSKTDGSLLTTLGTVTFSSIGMCGEQGEAGPPSCLSTTPTAVTISSLNHVMLSTEYLGVSFPTASATDHGVLAFMFGKGSGTYAILNEETSHGSNLYANWAGAVNGFLSNGNSAGTAILGSFTMTGNDYSLSNNGPVTIQAGSSGNVYAVATSVSGSESVTFSCTNSLPAGMSCGTITNSPCASTCTAVVPINVAGNVAPGTYTFYIHGSPTDPSSADTQVTVHVTAGGGGGSTPPSVLAATSLLIGMVLMAAVVVMTFMEDKDSEPKLKYARYWVVTVAVVLIILGLAGL